MAEARMTAYTEFGVPGISNIDVLKSFIPNQELFPSQGRNYLERSPWFWSMA